jgi:hypothetical protein
MTKRRSTSVERLIFQIARLGPAQRENNLQGHERPGARHASAAGGPRKAIMSEEHTDNLKRRERD